MIRSFRHKALKRLWEKNDESGIRPDWVKKVRIVLSTLHAAASPEDLNLPGFNLHPLRENRAGEFAVNVSRNWRITFGWSDQDAIDVNMEDYHGD
jgi:proteic killer suppression protein